MFPSANHWCQTSKPYGKAANRLYPQSVYGASVAFEDKADIKPILALPLYATQKAGTKQTYNVTEHAWDLAEDKAFVVGTRNHQSDGIALGKDAHHILLSAGNLAGQTVIPFTLQNTEGHSSSSKLYVDIEGEDRKIVPPLPLNLEEYGGLDPNDPAAKEVKTTSALQEKLNSAVAGDVIRVTDNPSLGEITIGCQGTKDKPILVVAATPLKVKIVPNKLNSKWLGVTFTSESEHVILHGFDLTDCENILSGTENVIRRCKIRPPYKPLPEDAKLPQNLEDANGTTSIGVACKDGNRCRIDYCTILMLTDDEVEDKKENIKGLDVPIGWINGHYSAIRGTGSSGREPRKHLTNLTISRCHFSGGAIRKTSKNYNNPNGGFCTTAPNVSESKDNTAWTIRKCVVRNTPTDHVIFEAKSSGNVFEFLNIHSNNPKSYVGARQGQGNKFRGLNLRKCNIRLHRGPDHEVLSCDLNGGKVQVMAGRVGHELPATDPSKWSNKPPNAFAAKIIDIRGTGKIEIGRRFGNEFDVPAKNTHLFSIGSQITIDGDLHEDTVPKDLKDRVNFPTIDESEKVKPWDGTDEEVGVHAEWLGNDD